LVKSGHISAAGLDVLKSSPGGANSPLFDLPQILLAPHIAGATDLTFHGTLNYIKQVLEAFAGGEKPNQLSMPLHTLVVSCAEVCGGMRVGRHQFARAVCRTAGGLFEAM
jgi:phosphoglycerate dehydrogenase-like enzyme